MTTSPAPTVKRERLALVRRVEGLLGAVDLAQVVDVDGLALLDGRSVALDQGGQPELVVGLRRAGEVQAGGIALTLDGRGPRGRLLVGAGGLVGEHVEDVDHEEDRVLVADAQLGVAVLAEGVLGRSRDRDAGADGLTLERLADGRAQVTADGERVRRGVLAEGGVGRELVEPAGDEEPGEDLVALLERRSVAGDQRLGLELVDVDLGVPGDLGLLAEVPADRDRGESLAAGRGRSVVVAAGTEQQDGQRRAGRRGGRGGWNVGTQASLSRGGGSAGSPYPGAHERPRTPYRLLARLLTCRR